MAMIVDFCVAMLAAISDAHSHCTLSSFGSAISLPENSMFWSTVINF